LEWWLPRDAQRGCKTEQGERKTGKLRRNVL
jgi:hypothetical protein